MTDSMFRETCLTPSCFRRATGGDRHPGRCGGRGRLYWRGPTSREVEEEGDCTGGDRHPGRWEKRETVLAGTDIPGGEGRGRLYWRGPTSREVREEGDCTGGDRHHGR